MHHRCSGANVRAWRPVSKNDKRRRAVEGGGWRWGRDWPGEDLDLREQRKKVRKKETEKEKDEKSQKVKKEKIEK